MEIDTIDSQLTLAFGQEQLEIASRQLYFNLRHNTSDQLNVRFEAELRHVVDGSMKIDRVHGTFVLHDIVRSATEPIYIVEMCTVQGTQHRGQITAERRNSRRVYVFNEVTHDGTRLVDVLRD